MLVFFNVSDVISAMVELILRVIRRCFSLEFLLSWTPSIASRRRWGINLRHICALVGQILQAFLDTMMISLLNFE